MRCRAVHASSLNLAVKIGLPSPLSFVFHRLYSPAQPVRAFCSQRPYGQALWSRVSSLLPPAGYLFSFLSRIGFNQHSHFPACLARRFSSHSTATWVHGLLFKAYTTVRVKQMGVFRGPSRPCTHTQLENIGPRSG